MIDVMIIDHMFLVVFMVTFLILKYQHVYNNLGIEIPIYL